MARNSLPYVLACLMAAVLLEPVFGVPYQDQGPVLTSFDGSPYIAQITGSSGSKAVFGLKQLPPYQLVMMRGKLLIVYGTKKDIETNKAIAAEEAGICAASAETSPNWPPPDIRLVKDTEVTDEDLKNRDVLLVGDSQSNSVTAVLLDKLPVKPLGTDVEITGHGTLGSVVMGRFLIPNPLNNSHFLTVRFGNLHAGPRDVRWSVAYRWMAAMTYFWHTTDYGFITSDGTIRGGYFAKRSRTDWIFDPKLMVTVPNVFRDPYEKWKTHRSLHFVFHMAPHSAADEKINSMGDSWNKAWESVYEEISKTLEVEYDRSIHVYFFNDWNEAGQYAAVGFSPISKTDKKAAGLTDARFGVILLIGRENCDAAGIAKHEVTHILSESIAPATITFNAEGLAVAMEGRIPGQTGGKSLTEWERDYLLANKEYPPLSALLKPQGFNAYHVSDSYPLAASFAKYLIDTYGLKRYKEYYKASTRIDPETALIHTYSKTVDEIQKLWVESVKEKNKAALQAYDQERAADEMYKKRNFKQALELAKQAIQGNSDVTLAYFISGACYNRIEPPDADAAISALEKYNDRLRLLGHPEQAWTYVEMGYANDLKGDREKAVICYSKAVRLPDDRGSRAEARKRLSEPFTGSGQ